MHASPTATFQSTLPTRGSDTAHPPQGSGHRYFNPRSPRGGATYSKIKDGKSNKLFQSTLPTRGSDWTHLPPRHCGGHFNPRSPRGGATEAGFADELVENISIHAPHEGERPFPSFRTAATVRFQSTLPTRGSDSMMSCVSASLGRFQSTLPTRGSDPFGR